MSGIVVLVSLKLKQQIQCVLLLSVTPSILRPTDLDKNKKHPKNFINGKDQVDKIKLMFPYSMFPLEI